MTVKHQQSFSLGLDIGMASVGWCLLGESDIIALGVRAFDKAEESDGTSLNAARREKRLMRRRLRRRAHRLLRARRLFKREGLIDSNQSDALASGSGTKVSPWHLRAEGLQRQLSADEWSKSLYHLLKFRGFHSNRKSELAQDKEAGQLLAGVNQNQALLTSGSYRTPADLAVHHEGFACHKRNKAGGYQHTFSRQALADELTMLFAAQRQCGNLHASEKFEELVLSLFWSQRPPLTGESMLQLLGKCTFEHDQYRAPKRSYSAERFVWLSRLNNLYIVCDGQRRTLTDAERYELINLPFTGKTEKITYGAIRKALNKTIGFSEANRFAGLTYRTDPAVKNAEDATLFTATGWHTLRRAYEKASLTQDWQKLALDTSRLNHAGYALSVLKTDAEIDAHLKSHGFSDAEIAQLQPIGFKDFVNLSVVAIDRLLPLLEQGYRYDQAAAEVYGHHSVKPATARSMLLPPLSASEIRNPVVFRALNQARKVVNALVREYGSPQRVHIELARDLSRSYKERERVEREQHKYRDAKLADIEAFEREFGFQPHAKTQDLLKWRLYREQDGKCPYSLKPLAAEGDCRTIFEAGCTQIDHVLPYSRSFDDGFNNKVLVLTVENQNKGNRTPYEFLDGATESDRWRLFEAWVKSNKKIREAKRQRLLRKHFDARESSDFSERNLTDTRYISRFFKNYVEQHLILAEKSPARRCVVVSGQLTGLLRARWGLLKVREEGDLHHALDAAVVAACGHDLVKRLADYSRRGELEQVRAGFVDAETGEVVDILKLRQLEARFPLPFPHFREKLLDRLSPAPVVGNPILVSRAPRRRNGGAAHKETIRSKKAMVNRGVSSVKTALTQLKLADLSRLAAKDDPRNQSLYKAIEDRLKAHGSGLKAFGPDQPPLRKPGRQVEGPIVRSVRLEETQKSGLPVRGGIADNDTMVRVDIFKHGDRHYLVPIYLADTIRGQLPNRAIVAGKSETEWTLIDQNYEFLFSLYPNDLVAIQLKGKPRLWGYYAGCDRSTGAIHVWAHDRNHSVGKEGLIRSIGVKLAQSIEKYHVDVLGRRYPVRQERRRDLAQRSRQ